MKRILVTGKNSYIGNSFCDYIARYPECQVDKISVRDEAWKEMDFSGYDCIFHVAGIAHTDVGKVSAEQRELYYKVNTELTIALAEKAKAEGVGQFIFMSSAIVYGDSAPVGKKKVITIDTPPAPVNFYGDSKVKAEEGIRKLESNLFKVVILRPPMIYGKGSKGNYPVLSRMAKKLPVFPDVVNERSMLYIENLCEFLHQVMIRGKGGIFWPQNAEYSRTSDMVRIIAEVSGKKIKVSKAFNWVVALTTHIPGKISGLTNKAFGNFSYDPKMSQYDFKYQIVNLITSIKETEV